MVCNQYKDDYQSNRILFKSVVLGKFEQEHWKFIIGKKIFKV